MNTVGSMFSWRGVVGRQRYFFTGVGLMLCKYIVDALVIYGGTWPHRIWTPLDYFSPLVATRRDLPTSLLAGLVVWTAPFIWIGLSMTVRRCRDAGLATRYALLFLAPVINYIAMLVFACLPTRASVDCNSAPRGEPLRTGGLLQAAFVGAVAGWPFVFLLSLARLDAIPVNYGGAVFIAVPFVMGFAANWTYLRQRFVSRRGSMTLSLLTLVVASGMLLLFALEGALCIAMAFPLAAVGAMLGGLMAREVRRGGNGVTDRHVLPVLFAPLALGIAEAKVADGIEHAVSTVVEIAAPPEVVWRNVAAFADIAPPSDWILRSGIAYPVRARLYGTGVGAVRYCEFSTGAFIEPIRIWDAPRRLAFDVAAQPPTMHEWSPYADLQPPHLADGFRSRRGAFDLQPTASGGTRLTGTTWYSLHYTPTFYWRPMADGIVHAIHERVLEHIRAQSVRDAAPS